MASPRSKRLAGPTLVVAGAAAVTLYTCPEGKVALIKSIRAVAATGGTSSLKIGIGAATEGSRILNVSIGASGTFVDTDTDPVVLAAGETLKADASTTNVTVTLSGAELTA